MPNNFRSTIVDFVNDLSTTFPEFTYLWAKWTNPDTLEAEFTQLFGHCLTVYPERFFDILNQNAEIFDLENSANTVFLPNVEFKMLYHCTGVSEKTRESIWKYLQVILFMLIGSVKDKMDFGDAANMFDGIDETELQTKLSDAMASIGDFFSGVDLGKEFVSDPSQDPEVPGLPTDEEEQANAFKKAFSMFAQQDQDQDQSQSQGQQNQDSKTGSLPKPADIQDHLKTLFNGKIGILAKELAEDLEQDLVEAFGNDMQNIKSTKDVFAKLMKDPTKISGLVKTVGEKLNQKMASGDISREDIMGEAGELMRKMKDMGGAGQFSDMLKTMAKGMGVNIPKGAKIDTNAIVQMEKSMTLRDKMRARAEAKKQKQMVEQMAEQAKLQKQKEDYQKNGAAATYSLFGTEDPTNFIFSLTGNEKQEKTPIPAPVQPVASSSSSEPVTLSAGQKKRAKAKAKKQTKIAETNSETM